MAETKPTATARAATSVQAKKRSNVISPFGTSWIIIISLVPLTSITIDILPPFRIETCAR